MDPYFDVIIISISRNMRKLVDKIAIRHQYVTDWLPSHVSVRDRNYPDHVITVYHITCTFIAIFGAAQTEAGALYVYYGLRRA